MFSQLARQQQLVPLGSSSFLPSDNARHISSSIGKAHCTTWNCTSSTQLGFFIRCHHASAIIHHPSSSSSKTNISTCPLSSLLVPSSPFAPPASSNNPFWRAVYHISSTGIARHTILCRDDSSNTTNTDIDGTDHTPNAAASLGLGRQFLRVRDGSTTSLIPISS